MEGRADACVKILSWRIGAAANFENGGLTRIGRDVPCLNAMRFQIPVQLPDNREEALRVLEYTREFRVGESASG
jgi:hypothetical protein